MDRRGDPYTPGSGVRPAFLAGREVDIEEFDVLLERLGNELPERSLVYWGLRGVGKTVLLLEFHTQALERGWASTDVHEVGSQPDFRETFSQLAYSLLLSMSLKERMADRAKQALGVLKAFTLQAPGGIKARIDIDASVGKADSGDPEGDLAALVTEIGEVARVGNTGALFLLDEMHNLDESAMAAICMAFHTVSKQRLPVALVAAGLPQLPRMLRLSKPYAERLYTYRELGRLDRNAGLKALITPAERMGVGFERDAAEHVFEATQGYPYFLQEYGRILWTHVDEPPISLDDVERVQPLVEADLDLRFFRDRFETASDAEQKYLAALGELGDGPQRTADVADRAYASRGSSSMHRDALLKKDLIWSPRRGYVEFTVPHFADYMRRNHPLSAFLSDDDASNTD